MIWNLIKRSEETDENSSDYIVILQWGPSGVLAVSSILESRWIGLRVGCRMAYKVMERFTKVATAMLVQCMKGSDVIRFKVTCRVSTACVPGLIYCLYCDSLQFFIVWELDLYPVWIMVGGSWFDHQRLWSLLMVPIVLYCYSSIVLSFA